MTKAVLDGVCGFAILDNIFVFRKIDCLVRVTVNRNGFVLGAQFVGVNFGAVCDVSRDLWHE